MKNLLKTAFAFAMLAIAFVPAKAQWMADPIHSNVIFMVRHIHTPVVGHFRKFDINVNFDENNLEEASVEASIDVSSIDMGFDKLAGHLKSADFFDVEKYPTMTFKSNKITKDGDMYVASGTIKIRDVEEDMQISFKFLGSSEMERGGKTMKKAGIAAEFSIDRTDFGVGQGDYASTGMIGGEVTVKGFLELNGK